jgi:nucleoside-diphosphate-sugar epimerase
VRTLVTGHNGFIGSGMVAMRQGRGIEIVGMDTDYCQDCMLAPPLAESAGQPPNCRTDSMAATTPAIRR